jgi:hypothetical protein
MLQTLLQDRFKLTFHREGQIVYINNKSGHYQPSPAEFYTALKTLTSKYPSLDPKKFAIEIIDAPNGSYLAWGDDFLASKGNYKGFEGPLDTTDDPKKRPAGCGVYSRR